MRVLKIVPTYPYTEERKTYHGSPTLYMDWEKCIRNLVKGEETVDPGVALDVIIYRMFNPGENENLAKEFIDSFSGKKISRGKIKTIHMENTEPHGFKIIKDAIDHYYDDYDYLIFQEDDISILETGVNYVREAIDQLKEKDIKGCVAFAPIKTIPILHFGGFYGLIPFKKLKSIVEWFPPMPEKTELLVCDWFIKYNKLSESDIVPLDGFNNFPDNHDKLEGYGKLAKLNVSGNLLYHLGK